MAQLAEISGNFWKAIGLGNDLTASQRMRIADALWAAISTARDEPLALVREARGWGVGASNRGVYVEHGMLCDYVRLNGPCNCGLDDWEWRARALLGPRRTE